MHFLRQTRLRRDFAHSTFRSDRTGRKHAGLRSGDRGGPLHGEKCPPEAVRIQGGFVRLPRTLLPTCLPQFGGGESLGKIQPARGQRGDPYGDLPRFDARSRGHGPQSVRTHHLNPWRHRARIDVPTPKQHRRTFQASGTSPTQRSQHACKGCRHNTLRPRTAKRPRT